MAGYSVKNNVLRLIKGILLLLIPFNSFSQFNLFRNFNVKDGLPSSEVYEMLEDSKGYFWFATDMGVSRFNGYAFENFSTENGLPDNTVYGIYEDHKKNIWFRSLSGKLSYYKNNGIQTLPCNNDLVHVLKNLTVTSLFVDSRDTLWVGVNSNFVLKIAPGRHRQDISKVSIPHDGLYVYEIENGFVYGGLAPAKNLFSLYRNGKIRKQELYTAPFTKGMRYSVSRLKDKSYLATMNNVILKFNEKGVAYRHENGRMNVCAFEDVDKNIIVGAFGGVSLLNDSGFVPDRSYKMLDQKVVTSIKDDKEHELWICTKGHGVFYIPYRNFKYYTPSDGLPESSISCITAMGNEVLVGHLNGRLSVLNGTELKVIPLPTTDSLTGNEVTNLFDFDAQKLFISSVNGIYQFDKITHVIKQVKATGSKKLIKLKHGNSLMSLGFRVLRTYDPASFDEQRAVPLTEYSDNIFENKKNEVLICSSNGLWTFNKEKGLAFSGEKDTLLTSRIVDVAEGKNGWLWFATRGEGIIIENGSTFIQIKQKDGLSGNMCRTLLLDSNNVVWVATNNGLNKIVIENAEPFKYHIETYSPKNGLLTNEVNYMIKFKGRLWLAHNNGISIFNPDNVHDNKTAPPVYITSILVNEVSLNTRENVILTHDENRLVISYNGLSFKNPGDIEYRYKLNGLDTNWIYTHYTSANFQDIKPGKYRFIVYAKNNDGYWSTKPATFEFVIEPAWWQTWWFRALIAFVIIGLVLIGRRVKLNISFK
jgi:ligand-binding sensor domain-containing protein